MKKKSSLIIAIVLVALGAAACVLAFMNSSSRAENAERGSLLVKVNGEEAASFSIEQLEEMEYLEVEKEIVSSNHENDEGLFRGVALRVLLQKADPAWQEGASQVIARSEDGYVTAFSAGEIGESDNVILAYAKNGEGLGNMDNDGTGPLRIIIQEDEFGTRSVKYVSELEVK